MFYVVDYKRNMSRYRGGKIVTWGLEKKYRYAVGKELKNKNKKLLWT